MSDFFSIVSADGLAQLNDWATLNTYDMESTFYHFPAAWEYKPG